MARNPLEFLTILRERIMTENITKAAMGSMLFNGEGIIITEDKEDEYVRPGAEVTFVETPYAQQLSWMVSQFKTGLFDVITYYDKKVFYGQLAEAANSYIQKSDDMTGLLTAVLLEATMLSMQTQMFKNEDLKNEVQACIASLTDITDKI